MRKRLEAAKVVAPQYNAVTRQNMRNSLTLPEDEVKKLVESGVPSCGAFKSSSQRGNLFP